MKHIQTFESFINEVSSSELENIVAELKKYTAMEGEWKSGVSLANLFKNINIAKAKKEYPDIFELPAKMRKPTIYFFRGTARPLSFLKSLGEPDEIISGDFIAGIKDYYRGIPNPRLLVWNERNFKFASDVQSWSTYLEVAQGFADSTSSWNQPPKYDLSEDLPVVLMINYGKNKNNIFMNPEWMNKTSGIIEGEVFHKGQTPKVDISIVIDTSLEKMYKDFIKENS